MPNLWTKTIQSVNYIFLFILRLAKNFRALELEILKLKRNMMKLSFLKKLC